MEAIEGGRVAAVRRATRDLTSPETEWALAVDRSQGDPTSG